MDNSDHVKGESLSRNKKKENILLKLAQNTRLLMNNISSELETSPEFDSAVREENIDILKNLVDENTNEKTNIPIAVEAIIRSNKGALLKKFISETKDLDIVDGVLINKVTNTSSCLLKPFNRLILITKDQQIPVMSFSLQHLALNCASILQQIGIKPSSEQSNKLMDIALETDELEAIDQFLQNDEKEVLKRVLFKVYI